VSETRLKTTRQKQGLKQWQVAEKAKVTTRHYQDIEAGKCRPNVTTSILIARALNSTVEELFSNDTHPK